MGDPYKEVREELAAVEAQRVADKKRCEHPTETVFALGNGDRRYTCNGCGRKRDVRLGFLWLRASATPGPAPEGT